MASYAQFGYNYPTANQLLVSGQTPTTPTTTAMSSQSPISPNDASGLPLSPSGSSGTGVATGALSPGSASQTSTNAGPQTNPCCENGRPMIADPVTGQTVCSCQYDSARLALSASYSRIPAGGVYGTPYPSNDQNPYPSIGMDSSAFYSPLSNPYTLKDSAGITDMSAWTSAGLQPTSGYYPYDSTLTPYGYGAGYDLAARRKNATRESTATLKAWLSEHKKNPYPTKGEKIMLAIITKMTLTQVSTWFANARRRLKKENKMTWEPKNKTDDDDDALVSDDEKDKEIDEKERKDPLRSEKHSDCSKEDDLDKSDSHGITNPYVQHMSQSTVSPYGYGSYHSTSIKDETQTDCGIPIPATKPKIWSLADTVGRKTPPPASVAASAASYMGQYQYHPQQQPQPHQHQDQQAWMRNYQSQYYQQSYQNPQQQQTSPQQQQHQQQATTKQTFFQGYGGFLGPHQMPMTPSTPTHPNNVNASPSPQSSNTSTNSLYQQQQQQQQGERMGFPTTDTPPQTPPNMKVPMDTATTTGNNASVDEYGRQRMGFGNYGGQALVSPV